MLSLTLQSPSYKAVVVCPAGSVIPDPPSAIPDTDLEYMFPLPGFDELIKDYSDVPMEDPAYQTLQL